MLFARLNELVEFLEFLEGLIPEFVRLVAGEFELEVLDALPLEVVGDFGGAVDDVGEFVGDEKLGVLSDRGYTCAVLMLPR